MKETYTAGLGLVEMMRQTAIVIIINTIAIATADHRPAANGFGIGHDEIERIGALTAAGEIEIRRMRRVRDGMSLAREVIRHTTSEIERVGEVISIAL